MGLIDPIIWLRGLKRDSVGPILILKGADMSDITMISIGICVVILSVALAKLNDKVDRHIRKFRKFEDALKKNATGKVNDPSGHQNQREYAKR